MGIDGVSHTLVELRQNILTGKKNCETYLKVCDHDFMMPIPTTHEFDWRNLPHIELHQCTLLRFLQLLSGSLTFKLHIVIFPPLFWGQKEHIYFGNGVYFRIFLKKPAIFCKNLLYIELHQCTLLRFLLPITVWFFIM